MSARTVTGKSYTLFINAESFGVLPDYFCTSLRIIMGGGESMFRCQPILDGNNPTLPVIG